MTHLPTEFVSRMRLQLGQDYPDFEASLQATAPTSIRLHPAKPVRLSLQKQEVPWCPSGQYLPERPVFTLDPLYHAGCYYVQEASSMILEAFFRHMHHPGWPMAILDLCAAPGGKATHLLSLMGPGDVLLANEIHPQRNLILHENLTRWGDIRTLIGRCSPEQLAAVHTERFDLILVDAPCSGEGMFRKDPFAIKQWSTDLVDRCAERQRQILDSAWQLLKPGGTLIYSTCTYNREENEEQIARMLQHHDAQLDLPALHEDWGIVRSDLGYRCYPHRMDGEGLFMSMVRKMRTSVPATPSRPAIRSSNRHIGVRKEGPAQVNDWLREEIQVDFHRTRQDLWKAIPTDMSRFFSDLIQSPLDIQGGLHLGKFRTKDIFIPDHALALSLLLHPDVPTLELGREDALRFLKKESIAVDSADTGIHLVTCQGHGLGWAKLVPGRLNNLLPHSWRIRMDLPE